MANKTIADEGGTESQKQLVIDAANALKAGMSYGQYIAQRYPVKIRTPNIRGRRLVCAQCNEVFYRYDKRSQKYCCQECKDRAAYLRNNADLPASRDPISKKCKNCNAEYLSTDWRVKYCPECREQYTGYLLRKRTHSTNDKGA